MAVETSVMQIKAAMEWPKRAMPLALAKRNFSVRLPKRMTFQVLVRINKTKWQEFIIKKWLMTRSDEWARAPFTALQTKASIKTQMTKHHSPNVRSKKTKQPWK